jgi:hypothetical protein
MRLPITRVPVFLVALSLAAGACGQSTPTEPTTTTTTTAATPTVTETFDGTLTQGGTVEVSFSVPAIGNVAFVLTAVGPLSTLAIGFGAGMWDATSGTCTVNSGNLNTNVRQGYAFVGYAPTAGIYCFRVFDVGNITQTTTVTFTVQVAHPTTAS